MVVVSDRDWATLIGFLVFVGLRAVDWLLPRGYHAKWADRWGSKDDPASPEDEKG